MAAEHHDLGGTVRARDAASTLAWVRPLLPHFGITRVANVTGLDCVGIPVWVCIRPNGRSLSVSQGKGITAELAQASAVMESIELYHGEHLAPPDLVASYRASRRHHDVVNPGDLTPGVRGRAYSPTLPISWIRGADLASGEPVFVPHAWVNMNCSQPYPDQGLFFATSTGLASGNHRSEALCHAVYEVIERDCEWRWERLSPSMQRARQLNADTVDAAMLRGLLDRFANAGLAVQMWDLTSDVGIPSYQCAVSDRGSLASFEPFGGSGCHLSAEIALSRALTEAAQSRLTFIAGSRDDVFPSFYKHAKHAGSLDTVSPGTLDFRKRPSVPMGSTFDDDLQTTLRLLDVAGFPRVVAVDHTRPEFGIPVVAVVIPGMREMR